jgi:PilZ domain
MEDFVSFANDFRSDGLKGLKKIGQRFLRSEGAKSNVKAQPIPADVGMERRSGRRVPLPLDVRMKIGENDAQKARLRDVNVKGFCLEPADGLQPGDAISVGFDGYPEVSPAFAITAVVRRILPGTKPGEATAMGLEIDRERTSADAQKNYRRLVLHYLHHRPLLDDIHQGYFEARCESCDWVGRVGRRKPVCSRCGSKVVPIADKA